MSQKCKDPTLPITLYARGNLGSRDNFSDILNDSL
jgi:hypothetical protein